VKTDKREVYALREACHLGAYRAVHRVSDASRMLRQQLAGRLAHLRTHSRMISLCSALLRHEGLRVPSGVAVALPKRGPALPLGAELARTADPLPP
jgi:hypothetical protein